MEEEDKDIFMDLLSLDDTVEDNTTEDEDAKLMKRVEDLSEEELQQMAMAEALKAISYNNTVIGEVRDMVVMGADAEFADAFSKISKANTDAIKIIADFALQKERLKSQKELKRMDIEGKKEINNHKHQLELDSGGKNNQLGSGQTNVIITGRDAIFEKLFGKSLEEDEKDVTPKESKTIDIDN